jgi:predicted alpha/beta superfamily hydrolase
MTSASSGRTFRVFVAWPLRTSKPPKGGYPVVYVLDGNSMFATVVEQSRREGLVGELKPAIIVGIGYPTENPALIERERVFDLSPPVDPATLPPTLRGAKTGGAADLEKFLVNELEPKISSLFPANRDDRALIGHSLGGLFVLRMLFRHPAVFRTYVTISPSIWWNDRALLRNEPAFAKAVSNGKVSPRTLILVGGLEQTATAGPRPPGMRVKTYAGLLAMAKMIDNARALGSRLRALHGKDGYETKIRVLPGETHNSEVPAALALGLRFALQP